MKKKAIRKNKAKKKLKPSDKNYTNALDLQFLSCYNHNKERKKQEEQKKKIKHGKVETLSITNIRNSTNYFK
jgi:hypothetical protein